MSAQNLRTRKSAFSFVGPMSKVKGHGISVRVLDDRDPDKGKTIFHSSVGDFFIEGGLIRKDKPAIIGGDILVAVVRMDRRVG